MTTNMIVCKKCKSPHLVYWDNVEMCTTFDWGYYCETCKEYIDPYDDVESKDDYDRSK